MTSKKSNPSKGPTQSRPARGSKKPYATLDLQAREVNPSKDESGKTGQSSQTAKDSQSVSSKPESASSKPDPKTKEERGAALSKPESAKSDAAKAATVSSKESSKDDKASTGRNGSGAKTDATRVKGGGQKTDQGSGPMQNTTSGKRGFGLGGFLSHMAAGIVGGGLAVLGGDAIISKLGDIGVPVSNTNVELGNKAADLEQRLSAVESAVASSNTGDLDAIRAQLNSAQTKLAELASITAVVSSLEAKQQKLISDLAAVESRAVPSDSLGPIVDVVSGLEKQLATIEAAAGSGGTSQKGLAKLTAISGRLVDLETTFNHQLEALRKSVNKDIDARIESIAEASEAAKSGTMRMDRQLATVTSEAAQLSQRIELLKADNERLSSSLQVALEETAKAQSALEAFKAEYARTISGLASRGDVENSLGTVSTTIADLKKKVGEVVLAERNRKANAQRIVLSLELSNLKRALDRGDGYEAELANVNNAAGGTLDLSKLETFKSEGVPTLSSLKSSFRPVANAIIEADRKPTDGSVIDQLLAGARSIVKVRKIDHAPDDTSAEAVVGRMEKALALGQLDQVIALSKTLSAQALEPALDWLSKVEARLAVGVAVRDIENQLKSSLSGGSGQSATSNNAN